MAAPLAQHPVGLPAPPPSALTAWLGGIQAQVEQALEELLVLPDEAGLDGRWSLALETVRAYALRPAKRLRPALLVAGWGLAGGGPLPAGLWRFAAGLELLHTFLLIHDDVADQALLRRGSPALHHLLGPGRLGEDLAVVVGDHLFARSVEAMLGAGLPAAPRVVQGYLAVCRQTAVGQYLDLSLGSAPLSQVRLAQTLRVADLKTGRYGFVAPLVCGARLAGADGALLPRLERLGRQVGLAYQLRDDLIGLFGDARLSGKSADSDFTQGKRTFPLLAAYTRATPAERAELEALWQLAPEDKDAVALARARALVEGLGGVAATERLITRASRSARRALAALPREGGLPELLDLLVAQLARRNA